MGKRESLQKVNEALRDVSFTTNEVISIINATNNKRCYYPELATKLGLETAVLLTQVEWRWSNNGCKNFYKFIDECASCRVGDSWAAELGMTRYQIETALEKVGTRVKSPKKAEALLESGTELCHLILYYKPSKGAMRWYFNQALFLKLRAALIAQTGIPFQEISEMANSENLGNGHFEKSGNSYSEQTQNSNKEKEAKKFFSEEENTEVEKNIKKRETVKKKSNTPTYRPSKTILDNTKNGSTMSLDFSVSPSTIALAIEKYKDEEWIKGEELKFINNYTNKNPTYRVIDWNVLFLNKWLVDAFGYKKQNEERYGKSGTTKNAGAERLERLEELATTDIFGDTSFEDLGRSILQERYGDDEAGSYS